MRKLKTDNLVINVELVKEDKDQKLYITFIHNTEQAEIRELTIPCDMFKQNVSDNGFVKSILNYFIKE